MAEAASVRFSLAPTTERERSRMLYELENGNPDEYPSEELFQEAKQWLEVAVHLSTTPEAIQARRRLRDAPSSVPVKRELVQYRGRPWQRSPTVRHRGGGGGLKRRPEAEGTPEGPERRRVKLEP